MNARIDGLAIRCRDLGASAHFYADLLGFERGQSMGGSMLELIAPTDVRVDHADHGGPHERAKLRILLDQIDGSVQARSGGLNGTVLGVTVDDVDAVVAKLRPAARGIRPEPTNEPYGVRDAAVFDPHGHEVWITGPVKDQPDKAQVSPLGRHQRQAHRADLTGGRLLTS